MHLLLCCASILFGSGYDPESHIDVSVACAGCFGKIWLRPQKVGNKPETRYRLVGRASRLTLEVGRCVFGLGFFVQA